ncbi:D-glycero-beta-D-manno-heptose 1,7-bisphosphate 7-phosphatase [Thermodesulfobacteriota bacterium]
MLLKKVVFLDRDGVINREAASYVTSWSDFEFLPGSIDAIKRLTQNGFTIILITNQSIINRKMIPLKTLETIHANMKKAVESRGGKITDILFCPHTPDDDCRCRKPKPGMILKAGEKYNIDLSSAVMVGDRSKDIACARNAGCATTVMVKTGSCCYSEKRLMQQGLLPDHVAENLYEAATWIIFHDKTCIPSPDNP